MKTVLFVSLVGCLLQLAITGPLQQQVKIDPSEDLVQEPQSDLEQVTESKLEYLPNENEDPVTSDRADDGGLTTAGPVNPEEIDRDDESEQEVQQVQYQIFEDSQVVTTPDDSSDEDVQSTERSAEDQSGEGWFCSVFGCNKS